MTPPSPTPFPRPHKQRWQPLRGGLLNLYRYDHEVFEYEDGRLLLRGNNGTGKSRVLALQLPFLLDGDIAPTRLEPDADQAKRIEWNLLMGRYSDRLGYTWIEFARRDPEGRDHYLTLGCGLHAVEGRGAPSRWFFTTHRRVGQGLFLQAKAGNALSREALVEALGDDGQVFNRVAEYREAVDRELFGLGRERYESLMNLLIQLRQPQLSRQLDERRLSEALRDALPRVSSNLLDDVADAFRSLDDERHTLARFMAAQAGAEAFLGEYRRYAQIASRRRSEAVRTAHSRYEATMADLRQARADLEAGQRRLQESTDRLRALEVEEEEAASTLRTLRESPQMREAENLEGARRAAEARRSEADRAAQDRDEAHAALAGARAETARVREREEETRSRLGERAASAEEATRQAGLDRVWEREAARLLPEPSDGRAVERADRTLQEELRRRRQAAGTLRELAHREEACRQDLERARERQDFLAQELERAREHHAEAHHALESAIEDLVARSKTWAAGLVELKLDVPETIPGLFQDWEGDESPLAPRLRQALDRAVGSLATLRAESHARILQAQQVETELRTERDALLAGGHTPPPAPHTRAAALREDRPGAPLWRLCDFAGSLPEDQQGGLEAALEASGLLDAWVTPGGELLASGTQDTVLALGRSPRPASHLGSLLVPCVDPACGVSEATVAALLELVGLGQGSGPVWVDPSGAWGAGPLHGFWSKPAAEHVGETARQARRRQRLAEIDAELTRLLEELRLLEEARRDLDHRQRMAHAEAEAAPSEAGVRRARAEVATAAQAAHRMRQKVAEAETIVADKRAAHTRALEERDRTAEDLGLSRWLADLAGLDGALNNCALALKEVRHALESHLQAREATAKALLHDEEAGEKATRRDARALEALKAAAEAEAVRDVLESSIGASVREILTRVVEATEREKSVREARKQEERARSGAEVEATRAGVQVENLGGELESRTAHRDQRVQEFADFAATRLLGVAVPALAGEEGAAWSVTRAVEAARRVEAVLGEVACDEAAWNRSQRDIHSHLQRLTEALLPQGFPPEAYMDQGLLVVWIPFQGRHCTAAELREALVVEVESRQSLLSHKEREVLENHLLGEVASHLHERIRGAERLVREMNTELAQRPTSTGMALRFAWEPLEDGPAGLKEVRVILLRSDSTWSVADRNSLGSFLQARIAEVRDRRDEGSWREHLEQALDYRSWHRFAVERKQDGQWKRLTRRTHGTGSGGEKAIALTIPQFAAAAAHYREKPEAPRLILLDEAFVGIDKDMRAKCMELMQVFDLDFVMTSEHEWGCYAALPGVAIYQLSSRPDVDAVGVTRWVWNGRERVRADAAPCPIRQEGPE